jgi:nucleoside-diphosphate-sugar epimerase
MNRVLVTGGAGMIGQAVVRRLLSDPDYEVRVADIADVPMWIREGAEVHNGDLRVGGEAREALSGCTHAIHCAGMSGGVGSSRRFPFTIAAANNAVDTAVIDAASEAELDRFVYISSGSVFERATVFPTAEADRDDCSAPQSADAVAKLAGELACRAAFEERGLRYTICRLFNVYGPGELPGREPGSAHAVPDLISRVLGGQRPLQLLGGGEQLRALTHVDDVADGVLAALGSPSALAEDFNVSAPREHAMREVAELIWEACGEDRASFAIEPLPAVAGDVARRWPAVEKAQRLLGWEAQIDVEAGIAATVRWLREREALVQ